jgi:hypothetical protein
MKYEEDPNPAKAKRMHMGIALKRRDSAPIVKDIYGGALDVLLQERDIKKAQRFVHDMLLKVLNDEFPLEKFILTKALGDNYKIPDQMCHVVLANRMIARDPGTAPKVGDRVQYVFVAENAANAKQGDRIEHIDYVRANKLHVDNTFYITNQIQNPVAQLFALCIDQLDGYSPPRKESYKSLYDKYMDKYKDEEDATLSVLEKKADQLESIMFLGSPKLSAIVKKRGHSLVRGPMDSFIRK